MESGIRQYEAENKTGNPVLDTLLTAKSMECQEQGINMTSVADGQWLGFLSTREICTLVGVPLDNAVESLAAEPDPEKRLLRVAIYAQSGCVMLRFENYCAAPVALGPDGLPVRSAHGGYDLRGVQAAARQHGWHHDREMGEQLVHRPHPVAYPGKRINVRGLLAVCTKNDPSLLVISTGNFDTELKLLQIMPPK